MRLIDADAFDKCLENAEAEAIHMRKHVFASAVNVIRGNLKAFPTIEPERKTGRLIHEPAYNWYRCSVCKKVYSEALLQNFNECMYQPCFSYCPNCGARMEEGGE